MEQYQALISTITLTMGVSWASGINLYAALLVLGIGGSTGNIDLPPDLAVLADPLVILAAGAMYAAEFFVDKVPGVDTGWDTLHTFIRIPAGALLAASSVGDVTPAFEIAAGIMGGGISAASHATKASTRALINTSPEPFSNWTASVTEDVMVFAGLWAALYNPMLFLCFFIVFILLVIWLLPKLLRVIQTLLHKAAVFFGLSKETDNTNGAPEHTPTPQAMSNSLSDVERFEQLAKLKLLLDDGTINKDEFESEKRRLLSS